jgi:hypothetical protein
MKTLKNVLLLNALSSGATGILFVVFANTMATLFHANNNLAFIEVGIFLVGFAILVFTESRKQIHNTKTVKLIIILDIAWVLASFGVVVLQLFNLSTIGYVLIAGIALWVAAMAYFQIAGLKRIEHARI